MSTRQEAAAQILREIKESTPLPYVGFRLTDEPAGIFDSKVGGLPYLPEGARPPVGADGRKLYLLAQIHCAELTALPDYPHEGMLQIFISDDDLYGSTLTVPSPQEDWRVVYYPQVDRTVDASRVAALYADRAEPEFTPIDRECKMEFETVREEGMLTDDYRFEALFLARWNERFPEDDVTMIFDLEDEVTDILFGDASDNNNKIGGYPFFMQADPRDENTPTYDTLLFQLDTNVSHGVIWGDLGVGQFFISREALKRLDFSDVLYNWDCG